MAVKKITKSIIGLLIVLGVVISIFYWNYSVQRDMVLNQANSILYDLNIEMDLLEYWGKSYSSDSYLEKNIKHLILNKLLILSTVNPSIKDLQGVPLEALSRLIAYNKKQKLSFGKFQNAFRIGTDYLKTVEDDVVKRVKERNEILRKPLKTPMKE